MWGNIGNFADLAKAAQELQEQAANTMNSPSSMTAGFFNMDALQQREEPQQPKMMNQQDTATTAAATSTATTTKKPMPSLIPIAKPTPPVVVAPKGKLRIPPKAPAAAAAEPVVSPSVTKGKLPVSMMTTSTGMTLDTAAAAASTPTPAPVADVSVSSAVVEQDQAESLLLATEEAVMDETPSSKEEEEEALKVAQEESVPENGDVAETKETDIPTSNAKVVDVDVVGEEETNHDEPAPVESEESAWEEDDLVIDEEESEQHPAPEEEEMTSATTMQAEEPANEEEEQQRQEQVEVAETTVQEEEVVEQPAAAVVEEEPTSEEPASSSATPVPPAVQEPSNDIVTSPSQEYEAMMEQFTSQLQRLEQNHQMEQESLQQQHQQQMASLQQQVQSLQKQLTQQQQLTQRQEQAAQQSQQQLQELQGQLQSKQRQERKTSDVHLNHLREIEKQVHEQEDIAKEWEKKTTEALESLEESKEELQESKKEYETLKERSKQVALELKERRAECRTLQSEVDLLRDNNHTLTEQLAQLEAQGLDKDQSRLETSAELSALKAQLIDLQAELQTAKDGIAAETAKGEEALQAYKKKAQQTLSVANTRAAAAVQAKEEAELEARAARATANSSMDRAVAAEMQGNEAMAKAKAYVSEMEVRVAQLDAVQKELAELKTDWERVKLDADTTQSSNEQLTCELHSVQGRLEAEQMHTSSLKEELKQATSRSGELLEEVERLRREMERLERERQRLEKERNSNNSKTNATPAESVVPVKRSAEAEATIAMLQQELKDANQAIRELKETLKASLEAGAGTSTNHQNHHASSSQGGPEANNQTGGMPLFYAMEKQAELTQARNEIARLASLLGDSESTKQHALEERDDMKRLLDKVESQLERQSRLTSSEQQVNLEYLKNVILSFLNAKTVVEKKALLPVIGTVLCLTPQEQQQAMTQLEKEGKISLDTVANSVMGFQWSSKK